MSYNLVCGHVHSNTKTIPTKKHTFNGRVFIGFRICEIPKKYEKEFGDPYFNSKGFSFFPEL